MENNRNFSFLFRQRLGWGLPLYILFFSLLVVACANIGSPDGGPYDEDPPVIVHTSPKYGATNTSSKKIVLQFNEFVKIENASENVMISPPQLEQPEIEASGKKIIVKLLDSIKPNTTYTIDFSNAIKDNNEGNEMGNYAFCFSTSDVIDTMQVSGKVLDASNLEPIKSILVGAYALPDSASEIDDSVFKTKPFERVSRTDADGHFILKGLKKDVYYRIYALKDQNQNFMYDQRSEMLAFTKKHFISSSKSDLRADTVWHDSIHYDSIVYKTYTHFYPDDIALTAFTTNKQDRALLKCERPQLTMFTVAFTAGADTLPKITGLNFKADSAFVIDHSEKNDSLNYWIRDSLVYNIDTLGIQIDYYKNDSVGLVLARDTFYLASKISKAKLEKEKKAAFDEWAKEYRKQYKADLRAKELEEGDDTNDKSGDGSEKPVAEAEKPADDNAEKPVDETEKPPVDNTEKAADDNVEKPADDNDEKSAEGKGKSKSSKKKQKKEKKSKIKDEDIIVPPMPEEFMTPKISPTSLDPDENITFEFTEPIDSVDLTKLNFYTKRDSTQIPEKYVLQKVEGKELLYRLYAAWQPDSTYYLECDTGMFVNIYGMRSGSIKKTLPVGKMEDYSTLFVVLQNADPSAIVQLLDGQDKVVKTIKSENGKADFYFIKPGKYYMRLFYDRNGNGVWDPGDYDLQQQPEEVFYYPRAMELKAQWEITQNFNPNEMSLIDQKPLAITKQKDAKKDKSKLSKNQQRLQEKRSKKRQKTNITNPNQNGLDMN